MQTRVQIVPRVCEYLVDVADITPPTVLGQGWLVAVSGTVEARRLMDVSIFFSSFEVLLKPHRSLARSPGL